MRLLESCQTSTIEPHTVRRDDQLVGGGIIEERFLVEELVVGLGIVGECDLDLAVLGVREDDGQGESLLARSTAAELTVDARKARAGREYFMLTSAERVRSE